MLLFREAIDWIYEQNVLPRNQRCYLVVIGATELNLYAFIFQVRIEDGAGTYRKVDRGHYAAVVPNYNDG